jgi:hypothetical protein
MVDIQVALQLVNTEEDKAMLITIYWLVSKNIPLLKYKLVICSSFMPSHTACFNSFTNYIQCYFFPLSLYNFQYIFYHQTQRINKDKVFIIQMKERIVSLEACFFLYLID